MILTTKKQLKILDFDLENRPLSYWIPEKPTAQITAIATCWSDDPSSMRVWLLGEQLDGTTSKYTSIITSVTDMLVAFVARYNEADIVTGHYIRKHDLPIINGALLENGMKQLSPKLTCDTKLDMYSKDGIPATQEHLSDMLGLPLDKVHMTQAKWREANNLTPKGIEETRKRVVGDVKQHVLLREKMLELNLLKAPKMWWP